MTPHTIVIGAGMGGLTTGALLLRAGHQVTVLEAHVYPGGCAGTFYHQEFRFDAGATLAGGFFPGGPHHRLAELLDLEWPVQAVEPAWVVHLPHGRTIRQWTDRHQWQAERQRVFPYSEAFWHKQERLAAIAWDVSSRPFPWPPQSGSDLWALARAIRPSTLPALPYLLRTISSLAPTEDPLFKSFLDGQLLISAQTTAAHANALYGSAALDLPRRGVNAVHGGMGSLAKTLVDWIRANGGTVLYRQKVTSIDIDNGKAVAVHTNKGLRVAGDSVVANLTPWALARLLGDDAPRSLVQEVKTRPTTWGAFTLYLGLDANRLATGISSHHQVILDPTRPLGEGNSVFISLSEPDDPTRAPTGMQAATLSTHTAVSPWWRLRHQETATAYHERRHQYAERLINAAEQALPGLRSAIRLCLPGTPVTFEFYTRRPRGMVGGFSQTSPFNTRGPDTGIPNLWLVGDSIFPGQSTAGTTLGGMRVATAVLQATPTSLVSVAKNITRKKAVKLPLK